MALLVQKFGGSSVGTLDRINHVASKVKAARADGHDVVIVVSAMYGETDRLIRLANGLTHLPDPREYDALISTGEQVSMALLSIALNASDCPARSYTGPQIGIVTDATHTKARILDVKTDVIRRELDKGRVVIIAGFQGVNEHNGVYTTDPHILPEARLLPEISFEEMLEMASLGAKVLQIRSVELASKYNLPIRVLSTFTDGPGTLVTFEEKLMQKKRLVSGIAFSREEAIISISGIKRQVGMEGRIVDKISQAHIEIDMIAQNATAQDTVDFTFTVQRREHAKALQVVEELSKELQGNIEIKSNPKIAKLSLVGIGMRSHSGVATTMFKALGDAGINIQMITTSEIKISVVIDESLLEAGVRAVHTAFELDKIPAETETTAE
jgi:aspartate kinase